MPSAAPRCPSPRNRMRPTCSTPIAESLSPTVWRHTVFTGTSCSMVPSRSIRKWEHSPGSSLSSTSGTSRENSSRVAAARRRDGEVLDDRARLELGARPPVVALGVLLGLAPALLAERDQRLRGWRAWWPPAAGTASASVVVALALAARAPGRCPGAPRTRAGGLGPRVVSASGRAARAGPGAGRVAGDLTRARTYARRVAPDVQVWLHSFAFAHRDGRARAAGRGSGLRGDAGGRQPEPQRRRLGRAGACRRRYRAAAPRPRRHQPRHTPPGGDRLGRGDASGGDRRPRAARARARRLRAHPDRPPAGARRRARAGADGASRPTCRASRPTRTASPAGSPGCPRRARRRCPCTWRPPART